MRLHLKYHLKWQLRLSQFVRQQKSAEFSCRSKTFWARSSPDSARIFSLTLRAPANAISVSDKNQLRQ